MDALLSGLGRLGPAAWACAGFAVLAVLGLVRPPNGRLRNTTRDQPGVPAARWIRPPGWLAGRSDGLARRRRLVLGAVAAGGVCLAGARLEVGPGAWTWLAWPVLAGLTAV